MLKPTIALQAILESDHLPPFLLLDPDGLIQLYNKPANTLAQILFEPTFATGQPLTTYLTSAISAGNLHEYQAAFQQAINGHTGRLTCGLTDTGALGADEATSLIALTLLFEPYLAEDSQIIGVLLRLELITRLTRNRETYRPNQVFAPVTPGTDQPYLNRLKRALSLQSATNRALVHIEEETELLQRTCTILVEQGGYRLAWIGLAEETKGQRLVRPLVQAGFDEGYLTTFPITWDESELGRGPTGTAIRTNTTVIAQNIATDPNYAPWREAALHRGYAAAVALPLRLHNQVIGALNLYATTPYVFDPEELELLWGIADDLMYGVATLRTRAEQRQKEVLLREKQEQLQAILDYSPTLIFLKDLAGRYILANRRFEKLCQLTQPEILGQTDATVFPTADHHTWYKNDRRVIDTLTTLEIEEQVNLPDRIRTYISVKFPLFDTSGQPYAIGGISTEITARKQVEAELRRSQARFSGIVASNAVGIFFADLSGHLLDANDAFLQLIGYSRADLETGRITWAKLTPPEYREPYHPPLFDRASQHPLEREYLRKDGSRITVLLGAVVMEEAADSYLCMVLDLTERRRAEQQLREKQEQYRQIFETTSDGFLIIDPDTALIVEANPACCQIYGYPNPQALIGLPTEALIHPNYRAQFETNLAHFNPANQSIPSPATRYQSVHLHQDGTSFYVEVLTTDLLYHGRSYLLKVVRNINEQVEAYHLLEQRVTERTSELATLLEVSKVVTSTLEIKPLVGLVLDQLGRVINYSSAALFSYQDDKLSFLDGRMSNTLTATEIQELALLLPQSIPNLEVVRTAKPLIIADLQGDTPLAKAQQQLLGPELLNIFAYARAYLTVPMLFKDKVVGIINLVYQEPGYYTTQHAELVLAIASQAATALENAHLYEQAQHFAAIEERQRLARELHDSTSQVLFSIQLGARTMQKTLERGQLEQTKQSLEYILSLAKGGLDEIRALILDLRPESLEKEGLLGALNRQIMALRARHGLDVHANLALTEPPLSLETKTTLYRIAREALYNVVKHAVTDRLDLELSWTKKILLLTIRDYGKGFDPNQEFPGHLGLRSMQERAHSLGATLRIDSTLGQGTTVSLQLAISN